MSFFSFALRRMLTAQKFCLKMKRNYLLVMLGHMNLSQGTQFPGGLRKPSSLVGWIPKCSPPIALGRPLFQKPVPKMSLFTRSWQGLAGNPLRLFINITISLLFKKTVWPLLFWALAHTRPFVMSNLDLVGISILASLLLGLLLPEATLAYGLGLSVPLVGPIAWAHQPFEVSWDLRLLVM